MDIKKLLGLKIKEVRKARNLTQEKMAELIGIEPPSLSNIENGKYYPTAENLEKILSVLNVGPQELYDFTYLANKEELLKEMISGMENNEKLLKLMYRFFNAVKFENVKKCTPLP